ncbi:MAG: hypothetical protein ACE5FJ_07365, partial [Gemmatimonadales bacterium]
MLRHALIAAAVAAVTPPVAGQTIADVPGSLPEAQGALHLERTVEQYLRLRREVVRPALKLSEPNHRRDAAWAAISLREFLSDADRRLDAVTLATQE